MDGRDKQRTSPPHGGGIPQQLAAEDAAKLGGK